MHRQLIRDVAHDKPNPSLAHLPSPTKSSEPRGRRAMLNDDWDNACQAFAFAARRWRHFADEEASSFPDGCGPPLWAMDDDHQFIILVVS